MRSYDRSDELTAAVAAYTRSQGQTSQLSSLDQEGTHESPIPSWGATDSQWLLEEGESFFFKGVALGSQPRSSDGPMSITQLYEQHNLDLVVLKEKAMKLGGRCGMDVYSEGVISKIVCVCYHNLLYAID